MDDNTEFDKKNALAIAAAKKVAKAFRDAALSGKLRIDACGHYPDDVRSVREGIKKGYHRYDDLFHHFPFLRYGIRDEAVGRIENLQRLLDHPLPDGSPSHDWVKLGGDRECPGCGQRLEWFSNGGVVRCYVVRETGEVDRFGKFEFPVFENVALRCPFAEGRPPIVAEIDVPSGQLVIGNNLHDIFTDAVVWGKKTSRQHDPEFNICNHQGQINFVRQHASVGLLTGFMGSGGTSVFSGKNSVILGRSRMKAEDGDEGYATVRHDGIFHRQVGSISFSLWWYGAADYWRCAALNSQKLEKNLVAKASLRRNGYFRSLNEHEVIVLDVEPGRYRMTHDYHNVGAYRDKPGDWKVDKIDSVIRRIA